MDYESKHIDETARLPEEDVWLAVERTYKTDGKIPAIKLFRTMTGSALKESKYLVEMAAGDYGWLTRAEIQKWPCLRVNIVEGLALVGLTMQQALGALEERLLNDKSGTSTGPYGWPATLYFRAALQSMAQQVGLDPVEVRRFLIERYPDQWAWTKAGGPMRYPYV